MPEMMLLNSLNWRPVSGGGSSVNEIGELAAEAALAVHEAGGVAEFGVGDAGLKALLHVDLELAHFGGPVFESVGVIGLLGQFEDEHRFGGAHQLEHFLFAVAGGLGDDQVGPVQEGILAGDVIAEGGFDEGTEIGGEELLRRQGWSRRSRRKGRRGPRRRRG